MLIAVLFIIAKKQKQLNTHQLMNKQNVVYPHKGTFCAQWSTDTSYNMNLGNTWSESYQTQKATYY